MLLVFAAAFAVALLVLIRIAVKGYKAKSWPVADGMIVVSRVVRERRRSSGGRASVVWKPYIVYKYEAENGETYQSNTISTFGSTSTSSRRYAHNLVRKYPSGKQVKVYCNPMNDLDALLEPGVSVANWFVIALMVVLLVLLIVAYFA